MLQPVAALTALLVVWYAAGLPLVSWRVRYGWDPTFRAPKRVSPILDTCWLIHWIFPAAAAIAVIDQFGERGALFERGLLNSLLTAAWLGALLAGRVGLQRRANRMERRLAGDPNFRNRSTGGGTYSISPRKSIAFLLLFLLFFAPSLRTGSGWWILTVVVGSSWMVPRKIQRLDGKERALFPFPDLPLAEEIRFLLYLHRIPWPVYVQPPDKVRDPFGMKPMVVRGLLRTRIRHRRIIPSVLLHALEPDVYTAYLARELAFGRLERGLQHQRTQVFAMLGCLSIPLLFITGILSSQIADIWSLNGVWTMAGRCLLFLLGYWLLFRSLGIPDLAREQYREAYWNWHDADPEAERTVERFVAALYEAEIVVQAIANPEVALHRLRHEPGLMAFLDISETDLTQASLHAILVANGTGAVEA